MTAKGNEPKFGEFYTEMYAKTAPNEASGKHSVSLKQVLCCTTESQFYQYVTEYNGKINGVSAFSGTNRPWNEWTEKPYNGVGLATTIAVGTVEVDCSDGNEKDITLSTLWRFISMPEDYTPVYGAEAVTSAVVTLPAIARGARITDLACETKFVDGKISYTINPTSGQMTVQENVYANGEPLYAADLGKYNSPTKREITLEDYLSLIYESNTDTKNIEIDIIIKTYLEGAYVGENSSKIDLLIPENDNTRPMAMMSVSVKYIEGVSFSGYLQSPIVAGKSYLDVTVNGVGQYGATIIGKRVLLDGKEYNGEIIAAEGTRVLSIQAIDSRGIASTETLAEVTVYGYRPPMIVPPSGQTEIVCYRCDSRGEPSEVGTDLKAEFVRDYSNVPNNNCTVRYRVKEEGKDWGEYIGISPATLSAIASGGATISNVFPDSTKAYYIQFETKDSGNEPTTKTVPIPAEWTDYQYNGNLKSWAFGEAVPSDRPKSFSLGLKAYFDKGANPIAFAEDMYLSTAEDSDLLRPISAMREYNLFVVTLSNGNTYLGLRMGDRIRLIETAATLVLSETSVTIEGMSGTTMTHIYGLI